MSIQHHETVVIGGGLAGLSAAVKLAESGREVVLLEATDRVGGRVRTDVVDGFTLDHGFQVLLTAYPACRELLNYDELRLRRFDPGALVRCNERFSLLGDPWRRPTQALQTAFSPVGTISDKLRLAKIRRASRRGTLTDLYRRPQSSTLDYLRSAGLSDPFIDRFFRPFIGGVFLEAELHTSSRMLEFVFRMFSSGDVAVPADGMAAIPRQLAERLPRGSVRLQSAVTSLQGRTVHLSDGQQISTDHVVVATESNAAARLLGKPELATEWNTATTVYYAADSAPNDRRLLMLRGDESGPVQTAVVQSNVAKEYAPSGRALISVSVDRQAEEIEDSDLLDQQVRSQLAGWFGDEVSGWQRLRIYRIPYGLPKLPLDTVEAPIDGADLGLEKGIFVCGDHRESGSIQGAMNSGIRVADAILHPSRTAT